MKITWESNGSDGRLRIEAQPETYDGHPPIPTFYLEKQPLLVHDDVLAVAGVLLFGEYCSGNLTLPRKVSPEVAKAIQNFCDPGWVSVVPVELEPRRNPLGDGILYLSEALVDMKPRSEWGNPRVSTLVSLDAEEFSGTLFSHHGLVTNSNARAISKFSQNSRVFAQVAVALIYAETFFATTVHLSPRLADQISSDEERKLRELLASCKYSLRVE